jgi:hypothetical protein
MVQSTHRLPPQLGVSEGGTAAAAGRVSADDDVRDFEVHDGVLDHGLRVDVCGRDDVGDVAVDEDVSRVQAENCGFGDAGVGAADPDCTLLAYISRSRLWRGGGHTNLRRLTVCERPEERWVLMSFVVCPCRLDFEGELKHISFCSDKLGQQLLEQLAVSTS